MAFLIPSFFILPYFFFIFFSVFFIVFSLNLFGYFTSFTNPTLSTSSLSRSKFMATLTKLFSSIYCCWTVSFKYVIFIICNPKVIWITTGSIITSMIHNKITREIIFGKFMEFPQIKKTVSCPKFTSKISSSISIMQTSSPIPAISNWVNRNIWKNSTSFFRSKHSQIIAQNLATVNWRKSNERT